MLLKYIFIDAFQSNMTTTPVFVGKFWNAAEQCYELEKFIYIGFDKVRGINVLLVGFDDIAKLQVVLHPTWLVREWMNDGIYDELSREDAESLMRACKVVPPLAKKIWNEALLV